MRAIGRAIFLVTLVSGAPASAQVRHRTTVWPPGSEPAPAGSHRTIVDAGVGRICRNRGAPVARTMPSVDSREPSARPYAPQAFVGTDVVAVRGADRQIVIRTLPALRTVATIHADGAILFADATHLVLWRHEGITPSLRFAARYVVSVDYATGRETVSAPMPPA